MGIYLRVFKKCYPRTTNMTVNGGCTSVVPVTSHRSVQKLDVWHRSNLRAESCLYTPPLAQAVKGHHAPDRFHLKKIGTGGFRKRKTDHTVFADGRLSDTLIESLHGEY